MRSIFRLAVCLVAIATLAPWAGAVVTGPPPEPSTSHYAQASQPGTYSDLGCRQARLRTSGLPSLVILNFGRAFRRDGVDSVTFYAGPSAPVNTVVPLAAAFADGYFDCTTPTTGPLTLALGVTNYNPNDGLQGVDATHGRSWAQVVETAAGAAATTAPTVVITGAIDAEPSWSTAAAVDAWVSGYHAATNRPYIAFGSADGCPPAGTTCANGWSQRDVWRLAGGNGWGMAVPQIYRTDAIQARQWATLARANNGPGGRLVFAGSLSQSGACADVGCDSSLNNSPSAAWTQLQTELNSDPSTAQPLLYASDIEWTDLPANGFADNGVDEIIATVALSASQASGVLARSPTRSTSA